MRKRKRAGKRDAAERLVHLLDIPADVLPWGMDIEIKNDCDVFVNGCTGISEYSKDRVVFNGKGMRVVTEGEDFELYTFADGRVNVSGRVSTVTLERGDFDD